MSYWINEEVTKLKLEIPISEVETLTTGMELEFHFEKAGDGMIVSIGNLPSEDDDCFEGIVKDGMIILNKEQSGRFNYQSGIAELIKKYKGSGEVRDSGEDGEVEFTKYVDGKEKKGKVVYE